MIRTVADMRAALRRGEFAGVILYEGPSVLDGAPVVVIANKITSASANSKTGRMVQTFIIRSDVDPITALATGQDVSICGDCRHRPRPDPETGRMVRTCYVNVGRSVLAVWGAYQRGRYARPGVDYDERILSYLFAGLAFRCGTYGDPTAAPYRVWRVCTRRAAAVNGYTHQWRNKRFRHFARIAMASADSVGDMLQARAAGWRSFRVRTKLEPVERGEVVCPASQEAGKRTTCELCRACGGLGAKAKASIVIMAHGSTAGRFNQGVAA